MFSPLEKAESEEVPNYVKTVNFSKTKRVTQPIQFNVYVSIGYGAFMSLALSLARGTLSPHSGYRLATNPAARSDTQAHSPSRFFPDFVSLRSSGCFSVGP